MSANTKIAWTDHTFNIAWGCVKISPGCANCYADTLASRYGHDVWGKSKPRRVFGDKHWREPLKWNDDATREGVRKRVFTSSMCDVFEDHATIDEEREKLWQLIRDTPMLDWQILTKRADRIADRLPSDWKLEPFPNVWLGVSIENNDYVERADHLRVIPAYVRFVSYEPALGPLDQLKLDGLNWIIYGGESGAGFRAHDVEWARDMKRRCESSNVAFFYKQGASLRPGSDDRLDGEQVKRWPTSTKTISLPVVPSTHSLF